MNEVHPLLRKAKVLLQAGDSGIAREVFPAGPKQALAVKIMKLATDFDYTKSVEFLAALANSSDQKRIYLLRKYETPESKAQEFNRLLAAILHLDTSNEIFQLLPASSRAAVFGIRQDLQSLGA